MKNQLIFIYYIFALHQVHSSEFTMQINRLVSNPFIPFTVTQKSSGEGWDSASYEVAFIQDVSVENDMEITYSFVDLSIPDKTAIEVKEVLFCGVDPDSVDGGIVDLFARAIGMLEKLCPIANGTKFHQKKTFIIDHSEFPKVEFSKYSTALDSYLQIMIGNYEVLRLAALHDEDEES